MNSKKSKQRLVGSSQNFKTLSGPIWSIMRIKMKTTSHRRQPRNMKIEISQQPLVGSFPKIQTKAKGTTQKCTEENEDNLQWKTTSNGRPPPMEDDLKIWTAKYLSNHCSDLSLNLNLSGPIWSVQRLEIKVLKVKYFSNHKSDLFQNFNFS